MAIKIQGSTIIDDSRNIVSAGIATINTKIDVGAGGTIFSADANVSNDNILSVKNTSLNPALDITGIGSVGIGITNPSKSLHVDGTGLLVASGSTTLFSVESFTPNSNVFEVYDREDSIILGVSTSSVGIGSTNIFTITPQVTQTAIGIGTDELITLAPNSGSDNIFQVTNASGSTKHFVVANNGNIGVGTTNPSRKLHVDGDFLVSDGSTEVLEVNGSAGNPLSIQSNSLSPAFDVTGIGSVGIGTTQPSAIFEVVSGGSEVFRISDAPSDNYLEIDTDKFVVNSSGDVGIGTDNPGTKLEISAPTSAGAISNALSLTQTGTGSGTGTRLLIGYDTTIGTYGSIEGFYDGTGTSLTFGTSDNAGISQVTERLRINSSGNIGIGTDNVVAKVDVVTGTGDGTSNEANCLRLRQRGNNANSMTLQMGVNPTGVGAANQGYGYLQGQFWGGGANPILLNPKGGNVGINSTDARVALDVNGDQLLKLTGTNQILRKIGFTGIGQYSSHPAYMAGYADNGAWSAGIALVFGTIRSGDVSSSTGIERMRISSAGDVGIGTDDPTAKLDVNGTLNVTGVSTFQSNVHLGDDDEIQFGDDNDAIIKVDATQNFILQGDGTTYLRGSTVNIGANGGAGGFETGIRVSEVSPETSQVELFYDNFAKLTTTEYGIAVSGIVTASSGIVTYYGDGSGLTNVSAVSPSSNGEFYTGISSSVQIAPLSYETSVFTFPSTAGKQYVIESINVANVDTSVGVGTTINIIASIEDSTGEQTYIAYNIPIVNGGLVDLLKNPIVAGPSDVIKMWTTNYNYIGVSNAAEVYMNYTEFTSTEYISEYASTVSIATADRTTIYTSSTYPTTIESIHLTNRTDSGDYPVSVTITNGVTTTYLAKDLILPRYSVVDILDRSKRIETNATIDIEVGSTSTIDVIIAGKQITS